MQPRRASEIGRSNLLSVVQERETQAYPQSTRLLYFSSMVCVCVCGVGPGSEPGSTIAPHTN